MPVAFPPVEPSPTEIRFPDPARSGARGIVAVGADFRPGTVIKAYRSGIFPWPAGEDDPNTGEPLVFWHSPDPRAVFPIDVAPAWSRSLRRTLRQHPYAITLDENFLGVVRACRDTRPDALWIVDDYVASYLELHRLGFAHSVEVWDTSGPERELVGGIYGLAIGGIFSGESMFHHRTDCSKLAFVWLAERLRARNYALFDVQVMNPHLSSLGCVTLARKDFLGRLADARNVAIPLA